MGYMNSKEMASTVFTNLNATTKDLINMGEWFLYEINYPKIPLAKFYLSTDQMSFFLSDNGNVIEKTSRTPEDLVLQCKITFNDIPKSKIMRNLSFSWS